MRRTTRRGRRFRGDSGTAIIELALVVPILALLAFVTTEVALAWTAENRVQGAVSQAARIGASSGSQREADRDILYTLQASLPGDTLERLDRVVIYRSYNADGAVPAGCIKPEGSTSEVGVNGTCNSYEGDTVRDLFEGNANGWFGGPTCDNGHKDHYWCPIGREDSLAASGGPHWIGVWIRTTHTNPLPFFFDDFTLERSSTYRIQPDFTG